MGAAIGPIKSCLRRNVDHGFSARRLRDGHALTSERYLPRPLAGRCRQRHEARASATGGSVVTQGRDPLCRCECRTQLVRLQDTSGKRCAGLAIYHPGRITRFRSGVQHSDDAEPGGGRVTVTEDDAGRSHAEHVARSSGIWRSIGSGPNYVARSVRRITYWHACTRGTFPTRVLPVTRGWCSLLNRRPVSEKHWESFSAP